MPIKNIKTLLSDATKYPAAIEAKLPAGAPKVSTILLDATGKIPVVPDFPMELPDLPAVPTLPELPGMPKLGGLGRRYVTEAEVRAPMPANRFEVIPSPAVGVLPVVVTRRGM